MQEVKVYILGLGLLLPLPCILKCKLHSSLTLDISKFLPIFAGFLDILLLISSDFSYLSGSESHLRVPGLLAAVLSSDPCYLPASGVIFSERNQPTKTKKGTKVLIEPFPTVNQRFSLTVHFGMTV